MKAPIFPVFALKTVHNKVVIGGGGGNEHFGKKNGVILLDESTYEDLDYLETEDIVLGINVYTPGENELDLKEDDLDWDEHTNNINNDDDANTKNITKENDENGDLSSLSSNSSDPSNDNSDVYLSCRGTNNFYLLKLSGSKFNLIKKISKVVSCQFFINSLFLIINKELFCVLNVLKSPQKLDNLTKKKNLSDVETSKEEYIYSLFTKNDEILVEKNSPENWENFFIDGSKIHKVVKEGDLNTFVYKNKKYQYEKEIGDIFCHSGILIYYLRGADSQLYFIEDNEIHYKIPKITCMNVEGDFTSVGTGDGYGYLFKGYMKIGSRKLCEYAITGISYNGGYFYYSSYNGLVDRKLVVRPMRKLFSILGFAILILALIYAYMKTR
ncbi:hypothetical protein NGRA_0429 [Nosema granulosis]|uniref:Uncharacterized protein n=1 Tax=Nosema granulosis TaxID=83296 RepID=A0A9P6H0E6_9MICR|nr:hypothetical protein NGRA_0429 [Nosema granulosis]